jgi:hypothetical protein
MEGSRGADENKATEVADIKAQHELKDEDTPDAPKLRYRAVTPLLPSVPLNPFFQALLHAPETSA